MSDTSISDANSASDFADEYFAEHAEKRRNVRIEINREYDIASVKPGDTIRVLNFSETLENLQIDRTEYTLDSMIVYVDGYDSLIPLIRE